MYIVDWNEVPQPNMRSFIQLMILINEADNIDSVVPSDLTQRVGLTKEEAHYVMKIGLRTGYLYKRDCGLEDECFIRVDNSFIQMLKALDKILLENANQALKPRD